MQIVLQYLQRVGRKIATDGNVRQQYSSKKMICGGFIQSLQVCKRDANFQILGVFRTSLNTPFHDIITTPVAKLATGNVKISSRQIAGPFLTSQLRVCFLA
ncbi:MAG: hypothetical protein COB78_03415 [Hyphomicrobiales bacterium]|nr:MAG: hypothetical protein COB78_03415 [Hyphomicrobiales bacterium]